MKRNVPSRSLSPATGKKDRKMWKRVQELAMAARKKRGKHPCPVQKKKNGFRSDKQNVRAGWGGWGMNVCLWVEKGDKMGRKKIKRKVIAHGREVQPTTGIKRECS